MKTYLKDLTPEEIIKRLKNGEVIKMKHNKVYIKMIDGIMVRFYPSYKPDINTTINLNDSTFYFETEEPFEIKETGLYKTRDGRKAFVSRIGDSDNTYNVSGIILNDYSSNTWTIEGRINTGYKDNEDIIGKWED
jgi:hypothetical protein